MVKANELRDKSLEELEAILLDTHKQLFEQKNAIQTTKDVSNSNSIRLLKKDVARLLTVMKEKEVVS